MSLARFFAAAIFSWRAFSSASAIVAEEKDSGGSGVRMGDKRGVIDDLLCCLGRRLALSRNVAYLCLRELKLRHRWPVQAGQLGLCQ